MIRGPSRTVHVLIWRLRAVRLSSGLFIFIANYPYALIDTTSISLLPNLIATLQLLI
ncbi:hypothetical protein BDV41DRAFT_555150 [Aspergillus transmontanensis]|uniref:Uncharacterized protein n=1 Tax=Aspergillus transmontanensis TaxID=1034304 RepID=A0A5N6VFU0_9EURO|nr:hypothetical protein BDV41DRAFT_555150 [Aspergillus transmontanensis]